MLDYVANENKFRSEFRDKIWEGIPDSDKIMVANEKLSTEMLVEFRIEYLMVDMHGISI